MLCISSLLVQSSHSLACRCSNGQYVSSYSADAIRSREIKFTSFCTGKPISYPYNCSSYLSTKSPNNCLFQQTIAETIAQLLFLILGSPISRVKLYEKSYMKKVTKIIQSDVIILYTKDGNV